MPGKLENSRELGPEWQKVSAFLGRSRKNPLATPPPELIGWELAAWAELFPLCERQGLITSASLPAFMCLCRAWARVRSGAELKASFLKEVRLWMLEFGLMPSRPIPTSRESRNERQ